MKRKAPRKPSPKDEMAWLLWDAVPDVMYRIRGPEGAIEYVSGAFTHLTGWSPGDWIGKPFGGLIHPDDLPRAAQLYENIRRGERPAPYELRIRTRSGGVVVGEFHSGPLVERGRIVGAQGIAREVTDRKRAQEGLARVSEMLQALIESSPLAITALDTEGRLTLWNPRAEELFGWRAEEVLGGPDPIVPEDERHLFEVVLRKALGGGPVSDLEIRPQCRDGTRLEMSLSAAPLRDATGHVRGFMGLFADIRARKRAEEALRQSEATYRSLVQHAVFGIYRSTLDGRMASANPALVEMLGYASEEEIRAQDMARNIYADPGERERLIALYRDAERIEGVEVAWKRKDGTPITVRLSGRPVRRSDGALEGFEMVVEDVTARRVLEEQLRQAQKMEAIGRLAGGLAHDFNNLLTAMLTSCDLLSADLPADSPRRDDVETICGAAHRGAELTQKLLAFSRKQPLEIRRLSLAALANDFMRMARRVVPEDVDVEVRVETPESAVHADPGAIEQILMNLVTNARDAMPVGGKLAIEVGRQTMDEEHRRVHGWGVSGEYVTLAVSDTGVGMDAEAQRRIFEPFFTTKPVGQGTGLGMAMVYGLVKQHDGFVKVYSEPGRGTTVRVLFPAVAGAGAEAAGAEVRAAGGGTETVLLVEDDEAVRHAATRVLQKFGYAVVTASDGFEALDVLEKLESPPDLIVSDVVMPRISGPHLLSKLRAAGPVPRMLFTSGYTARDVAERTQLEPGLPFLAKPWTVTDLLRKVREVLDTPPPS